MSSTITCLPSGSENGHWDIRWGTMSVRFGIHLEKDERALSIRFFDGLGEHKRVLLPSESTNIHTQVTVFFNKGRRVVIHRPENSRIFKL